jgi:hypothetical protein
MPGFFNANMVNISLLLLVLQLAVFVWDLGRRIKPLDLMCLLAIVNYLLSPSLSYQLSESGWYEGFNFMATTPERYFAVAFPGTLMLIAGLNFPFKSVMINHKERIEEIERHLADKMDVGIKLFWIGCVCTILFPAMPASLAQLVVLGSHLIYVGGLYIWFSNQPGRLPYLVAMFLVPIIKSVRYGMFGELLFWGIFLIMILLVKTPIKLYTKIAVVLFGTLVVLFIQSIKYEYRLRTWYDESTTEIDARAKVFKELVKHRADNPDLLVSKEVVMGILDRTNQGALTSMAVRYTPEYEPFAKGETIFLATLASFVPRFIWPDKPTVTGQENMRRFTGFVPNQITAMDIGQLGDAYVNFGAWGGAIFLLFYGLFYSFINSKLFELSAGKSPAALLWIPLFFAGCIQVETSVLSTMNHLIKVIMFCALTYWGFKNFLKQEL